MGAGELRVRHLSTPHNLPCFPSLMLAGMEESELFFVSVGLIIVMSVRFGRVRDMEY